jgi:hypothetical protein
VSHKQTLGLLFFSNFFLSQEKKKKRMPEKYLNAWVLISRLALETMFVLYFE